MRNEVPTRLANACVMSERSETSLAIAGFRKESEILRFAQNDIMKWFAGNIIAAFVIAGSSPRLQRRRATSSIRPAPPSGLVCINSLARLAASSRASAAGSKSIANIRRIPR